jgi:hypothetical protein
VCFFPSQGSSAKVEFIIYDRFHSRMSSKHKEVRLLSCHSSKASDAFSVAVMCKAEVTECLSLEILLSNTVPEAKT